MTTRDTGQQAEQFALRYLLAKGLSLIAQNYTCSRGELDLIMWDKETVVFVEVRYRKNLSHGSALESIHFYKQKRIITAARYFLLSRRWTDKYDCRFDVVAIDKTVEWVKDVFQIQ